MFAFLASNITQTSTIHHPYPYTMQLSILSEHFKILIKYFRQHLRSIVYSCCTWIASNVMLPLARISGISELCAATFYADIVLMFAHASCISIISLKMDWWLGCKIPNLLASIELSGRWNDGDNKDRKAKMSMIRRLSLFLKHCIVHPLSLSLVSLIRSAIFNVLFCLHLQGTQKKTRWVHSTNIHFVIILPNLLVRYRAWSWKYWMLRWSNQTLHWADILAFSLTMFY